MSEPAKVVITGFMGTGKSTVGRLLAERLDRAWVDVDAIVEARHGPIGTIFAKWGEPTFREIERAVAVELGAGRGLVISTGGGTMLDDTAAHALEHDAVVFCLGASPAELLQRIGDDATDRPLLAEDPASAIEALIEERRHRYERYIPIATDGLAPDDVVDEILRRLDLS